MALAGAARLSGGDGSPDANDAPAGLVWASIRMDSHMRLTSQVATPPGWRPRGRLDPKCGDSAPGEDAGSRAICPSTGSRDGLCVQRDRALRAESACAPIRGYPCHSGLRPSSDGTSPPLNESASPMHEAVSARGRRKRLPGIPACGAKPWSHPAQILVGATCRLIGLETRVVSCALPSRTTSRDAIARRDGSTGPLASCTETFRDRLWPRDSCALRILRNAPRLVHVDRPVNQAPRSASFPQPAIRHEPSPFPRSPSRSVTARVRLDLGMHAGRHRCGRTRPRRTDHVGCDAPR